jgi:integrase
MRDFTVKQVQAASPGRHRVSASLYLYVGPKGQRRWLFRYTKPSSGRVTEMGLGSVDLTTLAEARAKVHDLRRMVAKGQDPGALRGGASAIVHFAAVAAEYLDVQARRFRNPGSARNVRLLLLTHANALAQQPVASIGSAHVNAALRPLWLTSPEQARRTTAAVLRVLKFARAKGLSTTSASDIREDMSHLQPRPNGAKRHFTALDYRDVPAFVRELREAQRAGDALSPSVIEFILLTASRENEVCGMTWSEIDWQNQVWVLPAARSKTATEHRVPLSDRALALLIRQRGPEAGLDPHPAAYVWPGRDGQSPVTGKSVYKYLTQTMGVQATIHGFRSSFRDWCGNETHFDRVSVELCLAHRAGDATELAYRRSDSLSKRREIMQAWSIYCNGV